MEYVEVLLNKAEFNIESIFFPPLFVPGFLCSTMPDIEGNCKYFAVQKKTLLRYEWETWFPLNKYLSTAWSYKHLGLGCGKLPSQYRKKIQGFPFSLINAWNQDARVLDLMEPVLEPSLAFYTRSGLDKDIGISGITLVSNS